MDDWHTISSACACGCEQCEDAIQDAAAFLYQIQEMGSDLRLDDPESKVKA